MFVSVSFVEFFLFQFARFLITTLSEWYLYPSSVEKYLPNTNRRNWSNIGSMIAFQKFSFAAAGDAVVVVTSVS